MADGKCGGVLDAAQESLVLALQVADKTLLDSPETIQKILNDPKVKTAIEEAATKQAKELLEKQRKGQSVSSDDVKAKAAALGKAMETGSIDPGKKGDLVILDAPSYHHFIYHTGVNLVEKVVKNGLLVLDRAI